MNVVYVNMILLFSFLLSISGNILSDNWNKLLEVKKQKFEVMKQIDKLQKEKYECRVNFKKYSEEEYWKKLDYFDSEIKKLNLKIAKCDYKIYKVQQNIKKNWELFIKKLDKSLKTKNMIILNSNQTLFDKNFKKFFDLLNKILYEGKRKNFYEEAVNYFVKFDSYKIIWLDYVRKLRNGTSK